MYRIKSFVGIYIMKTNAKLNVCLIGCGRISNKHIEAIKSLSHSGVKLVGACDTQVEKLSQFSDQADVYTTANMFDDNLLIGTDLVVIATESGMHYEHAKFFVEKGIDVLIEKPATLRLTHTRELLDLAKLRDQKIYVVKQNRFNPAVQFAKSVVENCKIGKINLGTVRVRWCRTQDYYDQASWRGTWAMDGGVISNQAIHHIDLLQYFLGDVRKVRAYDATYGSELEAEDSLVSILEFTSGAIATVEATTAVRPRNVEGSLSLIGSSGLLEIGGFAANEIVRYEAQDDAQPFAVSEKQDSTNDVYGAGHMQVYREILGDRAGTSSNAVELEEAKKSLEIIHMMYKSIETEADVDYASLGTGSIRLGYS